MIGMTLRRSYLKKKYKKLADTIINPSDVNPLFVETNLAPCMYNEEGVPYFCGKNTEWGLKLPFEHDAIPFCLEHLAYFIDWTHEDSIREFIEVATDNVHIFDQGEGQ